MKTKADAFAALVVATEDARVNGGNTAANEIIDARSFLRARITDLEQALSDLIEDAASMDARLLVNQPAPGCEKGSIARAKVILTLP